MLLSIIDNPTFVEIMQDFEKSYELNIKYQNNLYESKIVINGQEYKSSDTDIVECLKSMIIQYLILKAKEKKISVEELTKEWKNVEELIKEIRS